MEYIAVNKFEYFKIDKGRRLLSSIFAVGFVVSYLI
jgi:hypothetical protein